MAYDEQRSFSTRPALHNDGRRVFGREQSIGFRFTSPPSSFVPVSSPPTLTYAPTTPIGSSRRPLPTPRTRPESMPPSVRQSPLVVQSPAPSRPAILAPSATLPTSPTAPPARRPLPTPALQATRPSTKHASIDLTARPTSPVKSVISAFNANPDQDLRIPSSFSRRTAPLPDAIQRPLPPPAASFSTPPPTWPHASRFDTHETRASNSVPFWNRNLPAPSPAQIGANVIERRSTVSGILPPAVLQPAAPPPRTDLRRSESPERAQTAQRSQFSPSRRPLPSSPTEPPRVPPFHQRIAVPPEDEHEPSSPSESSSVSDRDSYEPMTFADPMRAEDDEDDTLFVRNASAPSPEYGIRDLPTRSKIAIANRDDSQSNNTTQQEHVTRSRTVRPATFPQPPASNESTPQAPSQTVVLPQSPRARMSPPVSSSFTPLSDRGPALGTASAEPQSLTLRFASMGLAEEREREREKQSHQVSSPSLPQSPIRAAPGPTSPVRQQQGWPANVPPLPRTPGNATRPFFGTTDVPGESVLPNL